MQTGRGQVRLKAHRRRATAASAREGAQNQRTRRLRLARQVGDLVRQVHRRVGQVGGLGVVPWNMLRLCEKVWQSGDGLLSEMLGRCEATRFPILEQVSRLAADFREEARQAHEDDSLEKLASHGLQSCL